MIVCFCAGVAAPLMLAGALYLHDSLGRGALHFLSRRNVMLPWPKPLHQQCNMASLSTANDLGGQAKYKKYVQCTLVIVNAWIVNNLSLVNIFGETGRFFYNINYMLNSEHLSLVNKIGDKTEFTITKAPLGSTIHTECHQFYWVKALWPESI